jgi:hypothetical protein
MAVTVVAPSVMPSPFWEGLGVHGIPLESVHVVGLTRLQSSLDAAARIFGCPSPTRTFIRAFAPSSRLAGTSNIPTRSTVNCRGRTCTGRHSALQAATQNAPLFAPCGALGHTRYKTFIINVLRLKLSGNTWDMWGKGGPPTTPGFDFSFEFRPANL